MSNVIRVKEVSIANESKEAKDNMMNSIQHKCSSCDNDKFTLFGSKLMIAPLGDLKNRHFTFSLSGICTKCSHIDAINVTSVVKYVYTPEQMKEVVEELYPSV